ncbi:MAG TPA: hypothetical protein VE291_00660 [Terracidiphilus sp.]|jgi:hypothetical protein|nr:hypothetical protein [Terracidiphilus sp.]
MKLIRSNRTHFRSTSICLVAGILLLSACQRDISGSYLAADSNAICWLQIVRTPDNHLSGQIVASVLKSDGNIQRTSTSVTGAVDGENVTISGNGLLGLGSFTLSGLLSGNQLTLSEVQPAPLVLKKATLDEFQARPYLHIDFAGLF